MIRARGSKLVRGRKWKEEDDTSSSISSSSSNSLSSSCFVTPLLKKSKLDPISRSRRNRMQFIKEDYDLNKKWVEPGIRKERELKAKAQIEEMEI